MSKKTSKEEKVFIKEFKIGLPIDIKGFIKNLKNLEKSYRANRKTKWLPLIKIKYNKTVDFLLKKAVSQTSLHKTERLNANTYIVKRNTRGIKIIYSSPLEPVNEDFEYCTKQYLRTCRMGLRQRLFRLLGLQRLL